MGSIDKNRIIEFLNKDITPTKIDSRVLSLFLKQLSLLIDSGIGLDTSLKIIENQNVDKKLTKALHNINTDLDNGLSLYEAFYNNRQSFNPMILAFIKSGDESGRLAEVLDQLSSYMDEDSKNKSVIKQAMTYPILLLFVTIAIVTIVTSFVLPTFEDVFASSGQSLPFGTKLLMGFSTFLSNYGILILLFIAIIIISILVLRKDDKAQYHIDKFLYKHLPFKKLRLLGIEYQFTSLLYILRAGDVGIVNSLFIIRDSFNNAYIKNIVDQIISEVSRGVRFADSLTNSNTFSPLFISMVRIGEDSSQMINSLKKSSEYYSNDYIYRLRRFFSMVEPVMTIIMSILVAFVVFSIAIPIFDSVNAL